MKMIVTTANRTPQSMPLQDFTRPESAGLHTVYAYGVFGAAPSISIEISPDDPNQITDANANWFTVSGLGPFTAKSMGNFQGKARRWRANLSGGDGTTSVTVEMV